jgi:hypothetical protein
LIVLLLYGVLSAHSQKEKKSKKDSKHSRKDKKERSSSSSKSSKAAAEAAAASSSSVAMNQNKFGMWGILRESDLFKKQREFEVWMQLEKKVILLVLLILFSVTHNCSDALLR